MAQGCVLHRAAPRDTPCLPGQQRARWMPVLPAAPGGTAAPPVHSGPWRPVAGTCLALPPGSGAGWARDQGPPPPQGHGLTPLAAGELRRPRPDSGQGQGSRGWGRAPPAGLLPASIPSADRPPPLSPQVSSQTLGQGVRWDLHFPGEQSRITPGPACRPPGTTPCPGGCSRRGLAARGRGLAARGRGRGTCGSPAASA